MIGVACPELLLITDRAEEGGNKMGTEGKERTGKGKGDSVISNMSSTTKFIHKPKVNYPFHSRARLFESQSMSTQDVKLLLTEVLIFFE